jgi:hypothetical protein
VIAPTIDGEEELALSTIVTHRLLRAGNTIHHFLLAGDPDAVPVLLLGGMPDTWWTWRDRIEALATRHFVVAPEIVLDDNLRARQVASVLDDLEIGAFHVVADEHGRSLADDLDTLDRLRGRIISSVRIGDGPLAHFDGPELTNRAIIEWIALRELTGGSTGGDRAGRSARLVRRRR